jgi:2,3-bisphosphoglycerate-independent phosphoglycerate mutase
MKLILEASVWDLDSARPDSGTTEEIARRLDGAEIDGARFVFSTEAGKLLITMEGKSLSDRITANQPKRQGPVEQIGFKIPGARFTANTLNKLLRRANKEFPGKALIISDVKELIQ